MANNFPIVSSTEQYASYLHVIQQQKKQQQQQHHQNQQQFSQYVYQSSQIPAKQGFWQQAQQQQSQMMEVYTQQQQQLERQQMEKQQFKRIISNKLVRNQEGKTLELGLLEDSQDGWNDLYPDFDMKEWIPVDSFFDEYLETLTKNKSQQQQTQWHQQQEIDENVQQGSQVNQQQKTKPAVASNRQAQKRYRERLKKKNMSLEIAMESLQTELQELRAIRERNLEVSARIQQIEWQLEVNLESQIKQLRTQQAKLFMATNIKDDTREETGIIDLGEEAKVMVRQFHSWIAELSQFLMRHGALVLGSVPSDGSSLNHKVVDRLQKYVSDVGRWCIRAQRIEGIDIWGMIMESMGQAQLVVKPEEEWLSITQKMGFSEDQTQKLLILYNEYQQKMEGILKERQRLNTEIIRCMLPSEQVVHQSQFQQFSITTSPYKYSGNKLENLMQNLKSNMRAEQQLYSGLDYVLFSNVFTTLQAAWFYLALYPEHCDCVGLIKAAYKLFGPKSNESKNESSSVCFSAEEQNE